MTELERFIRSISVEKSEDEIQEAMKVVTKFAASLLEMKDALDKVKGN